jgi:P-type Cu2+ transporter
LRQNLGWATGDNSLALPIAAGVFEPFGFTLRPEIGAISMSGSSVLVAVNALALKRLRLTAINPRSCASRRLASSGVRAHAAPVSRRHERLQSVDHLMTPRPRG